MCLTDLGDKLNFVLMATGGNKISVMAYNYNIF